LAVAGGLAALFIFRLARPRAKLALALRAMEFFSPFFPLSFCRSQHRKIAGKGNYSVLGKWTQFL
jgi:hypothetical protein